MSVRRVPIVCPPRGPAGTLHGPAIALKPSVAAAVRTGGFYKLDEAAVNQMERDNVIDPISMERPIHQSTFRVQMRTPNPDGTPRYSHWDPEDLWDWVRRPESQGRMPDNREKIWYEDWWALYYTYGPIPIVPDWARTLDKREAATQAAENIGGGSIFAGGGGRFGGGGGGLFGGGGGGLFGGDNAPARPTPPPAQGGGLFQAPPEVVRQAEEAERQERRSRAGDRPGLSNDDAASLWDRIHGGGGGANQGDFWSGGQEETDAAAARLSERERMQNEERRVAQLPYQSLALLPPMTGINGHFFMVGGLNDNPTPLEITAALRYRVSDEPELYADKLHIKMLEQNLDPFHNPPHGMRVTLVQYEFNGLTDQEGDGFLTYYRNMAGNDGELSGTFYQEFFDLPTEPMEGENGFPKWGEDPSGRPPTLNIWPGAYDEWLSYANRDRNQARREEEELREQLREQPPTVAELARQVALHRVDAREEEAAGPRTRARAAAEAAAREEREQLDDF